MVKTQSVGSSRANNFDVIRLVAALMVLAGHMGILAGGGPPLFLGQGIQGLGVKIFFLVGGYLITKSWLSDTSVRRYAVKRFMRIIPPLAVYVVLAALVWGPLLSVLPVREYFTTPETWKYLANIGLYVRYDLPGVFTHNFYPGAVNGSLWALPAEAAMYLLMPILIKVTRFSPEKKETYPFFVGFSVFICLLNLAVLWLKPDAELIFYGTNWVQALTLMPYYLIGSLFTIPQLRRLLNLQLASVLLLVSACFKMSYLLHEINLMLVLPYFVFSLVFAQPPVFAEKLQRFEISYGLFLYGFFIQQVLVDFTIRWGITLSYSYYFLIGTIATAVPAYLSFRLVEQPCLTLSKKILRAPFWEKEAE